MENSFKKRENKQGITEDVEGENKMGEYEQNKSNV